MKLRRVAWILVGFAALIGCGSEEADSTTSGPGGAGPTGAGISSSTASSAGVGAGGSGGAGAGGAGGEASALCPTRFEYVPDGSVTNPRIAGEWQGFDANSAPHLDGPDASGAYSVSIDLPPGL